MKSVEMILDVTCLMPERLSGIGIYTKNLYKAIIKQGKGVIPVIKSSRSFKKSFVQDHIGCSAIPFWLYELKKMYSFSSLLHGPDFYLLSSSHRLKTVVTIHDLAVFHEGFNSQEFRLRGQEQIKHLMFQQKPDTIITPSKAIKDEVLQMFPSYQGRVFHVWHGGDHLLPHEIDEEVIASGRPFFLYVGHLEHRKNLLNIISAFELFCQKTTDFDLYIVGKDGFGANEIRQKITNSSAKKYIIDKGFVTSNELVNLYRQARAFIFPSAYEGFGFPILEAMALQCPVITSTHGAMKEIAGNAAYTVKYDSPEDICGAMEFFSSDEVSRMTFVLKGMEHVKNFTWDSTAKKTLEVYGI